MNEIWDLVDRDGIKNGVKWLRENHESIPDGLYHPCVEVWVKVGDKLLLTRRHPDKSDGLKLDAPGGAVLSGESMAEGAVRELYEEVGIKASVEDLRLLGSYLGKKAYVLSYLLELDCLAEIHLQPSEVVGYLLVTSSELEELADQLCEGCKNRYFMFKDQIF